MFTKEDLVEVRGHTTWRPTKEQKKRGYKSPSDTPERRRKHYRDNVALYAAYNLKFRDGRRAVMREAKSAPCADCGGLFPPECMDFDHVRGDKVDCVARMFMGGGAAFLAEIAKCEVVCSNCHRIRTKERRNTEAT
jgi:hypothetical protein